MRVAATLLLAGCLLMGSCVRAHVKVDGKWSPDRVPPTAEQILKLSEIEGWVEPPPLPMKLYTTPALPVAGAYIRVTCILPAHPEGTYRLEIGGLHTAEGVAKREVSYLFKLGCDDVPVVCEYKEYRSPLGFMDPQTRTMLLEPAGDCK